MYTRGNSMLLEYHSDAEQEMGEKKLSKAADQGKPISLQSDEHPGDTSLHTGPVELGFQAVDFSGP